MGPIVSMSVPAGWRRLGLADLLPVTAAVAVFLLLAAFVSADPVVGVTASRGPFTDEAWNVVNARNLVLLGRWSTDN